VIGSNLPAPWVVLEARWTHGTIEQAGLTFENDDVLHEIFSPIHPYNAFAVFTPSGELKGWYGNVTWPAFFAPGSDGRVLVWHDLFIDLVAAPDGQMQVLDEEELAEFGLEGSDPELFAPSPDWGGPGLRPAPRGGGKRRDCLPTSVPRGPDSYRLGRSSPLGDRPAPSDSLEDWAVHKSSAGECVVREQRRQWPS
jgi:hypothetical protein